MENGVVIRDIDNSAHTAEQELESYFNVDFTEEQNENKGSWDEDLGGH